MLVLSAAISFQSVAQVNFWKDVADNAGPGLAARKTIAPTQYRSLELNTEALRQALLSAPKEFTPAAEMSPLIMDIPSPNGGFSKFAVVYSSIMAPALQAQFPNIRTYSGYKVDDPSVTIRFDITEFGFHAQIRSVASDLSYYIDPAAAGQTSLYMSYHRKDLPAKTHIETGVLEEQLQSMNGLAQRTDAGVCLGTNLRTYRTAIACTGEYAAAVGATTVAQALSAITTTLNRVNGIFETELSVRLTLVANNTSIIFTDGTSDPFNGNSTASTLINESQTVIDANIGSSNYDLGHTFSTGAGGLAQSPSVCTSGKARGVTGSTQPTGDAYDVDFVAHEMGHQLGGSHTFNAITGNCGGGNRSTVVGTRVEPGSGITIMGYAGICGSTNNLASNSIPYFHAASQNQIGLNITTGSGSTCGTLTATGNAVPLVSAGGDFIIPRSTPFMLTGSASDVNNNQVLTYSWEDINDGGPTGGNWGDGTKPFFRSFAPTLSSTRVFPKMADVISQTTTIGEFLPASAQTLDFRLTVRDNRAGGGAICSDDMVITVDGTAGPFTVTSQGIADTWTAGQTTTVTWDKANTDVAPISTANVSILFSADGGLTFPYTILASTPNDGTQTITIPSIATTRGKLMVKAVGNVFFNVNNGVITINTSCTAEGATIAPTTTVTGEVGTSALNLTFTPQYSTPLAPAGTIETTDPASTLAVLNSTTSNCINGTGNATRYDSYPFVVTQTGSYTITRTSGSTSLMMTLYSSSFSPSSPCTNFVASNGTYNGSSVAIASTVTATLTAGTSYVLIVGSFSASAPTLPSAYSLTVTPPSGGNAFSGTGLYANPGAGFSYAYVVVNNSTNNIVSIGTTNLTNSSTYPPGQYTVYGLSYNSSISNLNTYVGGSLTALLNQAQNNPSTFCASLSKNSVTVNVTGTFPVEFTALKARKNGDKVDLDWGTVTEVNSSYFVVQRSANGTEFNKDVDRVQAAGNSTQQRSYKTIDAAPLKGWNYYRVQQVDLNGRISYSNTAAVNFAKAGSLMVVYPNPTITDLNIEYTAVASGKLELQVLDSKGAVVIRQNMSVSNGRNVETISVAHLTPGMYILRYQESDGTVSHTRFVKQ